MNNYFPGVEKPSLCQHFPGPEGHLFPQQPQLGEKAAFKSSIPGRYLVRAINSAWAERAQNMSHKPHWGLGRLKKLVLWLSHRVSCQGQSWTSTLMTSCWALAAPEPPEPGSSSWPPPPDGDSDEDDDSNDDDDKNDNGDDENNRDRNRNEHGLLSASHAFS